VRFLKRKVILALVPIVIAGVFLFVFRAVNVFYSQPGGGDVLAKAFGSSGAAIVETNINAYASDTNVFLDKQEVTKMVRSLAEGIGLDFEGAERVENFSHDYNQLSVIGKNDEGYSIVIIVHSMDFTEIDEGPGGFETNIVVDGALGGDIEKLPYMEKRISKLVEQHIEGAHTACCVVGSFSESIPKDNMEAIINSIFQSVDASEVERAVYDGFLSVSAYTPLINNHIEIGENKVNLNIAMRYNSFEGRTYIWLGSPVISLEY
jgi:hypothetical protein